MIRCYTAANLLEARMVSDLLESAGIKTHVFNENAQGGIGEIPFTHAYPEIWLVDDSDMARARKIISDYETKAGDASSRNCSQCGEPNPGSFHICWNCGRAMD